VNYWARLSALSVTFNTIDRHTRRLASRFIAS
jgi:hypothetical protein